MKKLTLAFTRVRKHPFYTYVGKKGYRFIATNKQAEDLAKGGLPCGVSAVLPRLGDLSKTWVYHMLLLSVQDASSEDVKKHKRLDMFSEPQNYKLWPNVIVKADIEHPGIFAEDVLDKAKEETKALAAKRKAETHRMRMARQAKKHAFAVKEKQQKKSRRPGKGAAKFMKPAPAKKVLGRKPGRPKIKLSKKLVRRSGHVLHLKPGSIKIKGR